MSVSNGQNANSTNFNNAFMSRTANTTTTGTVGLNNAAAASGTAVANSQREHNAIASFVGMALNQVYNFLPTWATNIVGSASQTVKARIESIVAKFAGSGGHAHTGVDGDGALIAASSISTVPLRGYVLQGTDLTGASGSSTTVTTEMSGKTASTGSSVAGVVVTAPNNKVLIRQASGTNQDDDYVDTLGNVVYARLTEAAGVWTLSYYVELSGTETAYSFALSSDVRWYYQELFNPLSGLAPVYSEFAAIPSDNATADVIVATDAFKGKVQLSNEGGTEISGSAGVAGTADAEVANKDHTHRGVHAVFETADATNKYGDIEFEAGSNVGIAVSGNKFTFSASTGGGTPARELVDGRLTLTTAVPVTTADVTAATTLYFTPYKGNRIALYDGADWDEYTFTERSIAVPATTATMYDVFLYDDAGTLTLDLVAWTDDTTRATALAVQDGIYVKTAALTRRYLGSFRTTAVSGQTEDSAKYRGVWNYYNRVDRELQAPLETTDSWTYSTATIRQARASATNQFGAVIGVVEETLYAHVVAACVNSTTTTREIGVGIGVDSTTVNSASLSNTALCNSVHRAAVSSFYNKCPTAGYHFYAWLEYGAGTDTQTWFGDAGNAAVWQNGMIGRVRG